VPHDASLEDDGEVSPDLEQFKFTQAKKSRPNIILFIFVDLTYKATRDLNSCLTANLFISKIVAS
jgi:hypothetical protein